MRYYLSAAAAFGLACALTAGCGLFNSSSDKSSSSTPTSPTTPTVNMDQFAGTWTSMTASTPATGCGNVQYTVTPVSSTSANVTFAGTCGGNINVTGTGSGTLSGGSLAWGAQGLVSQGGVNCPFTFANGTATPDSSGNVAVAYSGTVCGIPVSGTETVKK
ncbi:MAG TPA: hypothetical protein VFX12_16170 [Vicinamibacterales bacterium]|nr:hypothetical protein [Vicinamibacterales bacterium]